MPKMVVNAAMDELQTPDDTHLWWDDMPEPKHFLLVPNADHSMATGIFEGLPAIAAFAVAKYLNKDVPEVTWVRDDDKGRYRFRNAHYEKRHPVEYKGRRGGVVPRKCSYTQVFL